LAAEAVASLIALASNGTVTTDAEVVLELMSHLDFLFFASSTKNEKVQKYLDMSENGLRLSRFLFPTRPTT
jgi:hypothetical protein